MQCDSLFVGGNLTEPKLEWGVLNQFSPFLELSKDFITYWTPATHEHDLTHWAWVTHICVGNLTIISSDNGLSLGRRQAITWTNVGILLIGLLGTNFSEMLIEIHTFSFKKIHLKMLSGKMQPFCLSLNVLKDVSYPFTISKFSCNAEIQERWRSNPHPWCIHTTLRHEATAVCGEIIKQKM